MPMQEEDYYSELYSEPQPLTVLIQDDNLPYLLDLNTSLHITFLNLKQLIWKNLSDLKLVHLMRPKREYYFEFLDQYAFRRVGEAEESYLLSSLCRFRPAAKNTTLLDPPDPLANVITMSLSTDHPSDVEARLIEEQLTAALCHRTPLCIASPDDAELAEMLHCASEVRRSVDSELQPEAAKNRDSFEAWLRMNFPVALTKTAPSAVSQAAHICLSVRRLQRTADSRGRNRSQMDRTAATSFFDIAVELNSRPGDILAQLRRHPDSRQLLTDSEHQLIKLCGRMVFLYENVPLWAYKVVQRHVVHHRTNLEIRIVEPREVHELLSVAGTASNRVLETLRNAVLRRYVSRRRSPKCRSIVGISQALKFSVTLHGFKLDPLILSDSEALATAAAASAAATAADIDNNEPDYFLNMAPTLNDSSLCQMARIPLQASAAAVDCHNQLFDIAWRDLPRAARLSMAIMVRTQRSLTPVAWGNLCLFDSHGRLKMGTFSFGLWPVERTPSKQLLQTFGPFNPSGCAQSNNCHPPAVLQLNIGNELPNAPIYWSRFVPYSVYLSQSLLLHPLDSEDDSECAYGISSNSWGSLELPDAAGDADAAALEPETAAPAVPARASAAPVGNSVAAAASTVSIAEDSIDDKTLADALNSLETADQDMKLIWKCRRRVARLHPERIVKFCQAIPWRSASSVDEAYRLLAKWQLAKVSLEAGLQLLNCSCLDSTVRSIGVRIINMKNKGEDDMLCLILMQMVECLKYEAYPDSALARYLLRKAFSNRQIGHHLYYLMKAEMLSSDSNSHRLGIFLEAFLLFSPSSLLDYLNCQIGLAMRLSGLADLARSCGKLDDATRQLRCGIQSQLDCLSNVWSPAHPDILLSRPDLEKCRVLDSKMRPLLLAWSREDSATGLTSLIFKCGDDLRQDMLILHCLRLMTFIWDQSDINISLSLYEVVTCGERKGFIEVVQDADTVAKILRSTDDPSLSRVSAYLKKYNASNYELVSSLQRFMSSLVGYSVATYILGIGDRHCGNIMLRKNGVLFHIDFGHILGNFKSKLGIRRERVPFVLAKEFLDALSELGRLTKRDNIESEFRELCVRAYMAIRERSELLLNLFALMLKVGLDELKDTTDLDYLIESLQSNSSPEAAERHFRKKFEEAKAGNWSVTVNWMFYRMWRKN